MKMKINVTVGYRYLKTFETTDSTPLLRCFEVEESQRIELSEIQTF